MMNSIVFINGTRMTRIIYFFIAIEIVIEIAIEIDIEIVIPIEFYIS